MASHVLRELHVKTESAFTENAASVSSNTYTARVPVLSIDSPQPEHPRIDNGALLSRQNDSEPGLLGVRSAVLEFSALWGGHCTTTVGALSETWLQDLLSDGLGGGDTASVGTSAGWGTGSAASFDVEGAGVCTRGAVVRVGSKGDGAQDGQAAVVASLTGDTYSLLNALPAVTTGSDVVIHATMMAYPAEDMGSSKAFMVGYADTGAQYHYVGCHLESLAFKLAMGALPEVSLRYRAAYWDKSAVAIPSALALHDNRAAPWLAGGSVVLQATGTTTRTTVTPAEISLTLDMDLQAKPGPMASAASYQIVSGYERTRCVPTVSMLVPWSTSYDSLYDTDGSGTTYMQILACGSAVDGRSVGFYLPRAYAAGAKPMIENYNGLLYQRLTFRGREGLDTTSDLTRSAFRLFAG